MRAIVHFKSAVPNTWIMAQAAIKLAKKRAEKIKAVPDEPKHEGVVLLCECGNVAIRNERQPYLRRCARCAKLEGLDLSENERIEKVVLAELAEYGPLTTNELTEREFGPALKVREAVRRLFARGIIQRHKLRNNLGVFSLKDDTDG